MALGFKRIGSGSEKVICIHGWMTDHSCFDSLIPSFDLDRYTFILADQRGYGKSKDLEGPYNIKQVATDLLSLVENINWNRFHVIGHSMGGKVIQQMMIDSPGRIISAIGITPVPACTIPLPEEILNLFSNAVTNEEARIEVFHLATAYKYSDTWYDNIKTESERICTPEAFRSYLNSWVNDDISKEIDGCSIPMLVVTGENDADITAELLQATFGKWMTNVRILTLPCCGHFPMYETPLALGAECQKFLGNVGESE